MNPSSRVRTYRNVMDPLLQGMAPLINLYRPFVDGLDNLPRDGRFLLVGNHTQSGIEGPLIPYMVRQKIDVRVRPLTERMMGRLPGPIGDLFAAYGAVVGSPENARKLMQNNEPILVFPGGGREISKFKGEEYILRWQGRAGFARLCVEHDYPIVPVALVGGDDVYKSVLTRESWLAQLGLDLTEKLFDRRDNPLPLARGIGPTLIPRPQRMYLRFGEPISTTMPAEVSAEDWALTVKENTQRSVERLLCELLAIRKADPYRQLNPLAWRAAAR